MSKKPYLVLISFFVISVAGICQPPGDPTSGGDPDVPITGIEILLGVGGVLGARKVYNRKKNKSL